jgi:predicted YcjX-like family ATPase
MSGSGRSVFGWMRSIFGWMRSVFGSAGVAVDAAMNETLVRVAVTGLSRAGKTTFITSTVHNLLAANKANTVEALRDIFGVGEDNERLKSIGIVPPAAGTVPFFDYQEKLARLAAVSPSWPERTEDLARITLQLELRRTGMFKHSRGNRRIRLEILDYPGEWLIDLPMMEQSYEAWSAATIERLRQPQRLEIFGQFLQATEAVDVDGAPKDEQLRRVHALYKEALLEARDRRGLRYLQPGRFLCPGPRADAPFMWFFPLPIGPGQSLRASSAGALLRDRFETYKNDMKRNFFSTFFADFDRQVVLVDVLGALHAGKAAFEDTADAITEIAGSMSYGMNAPARLIRSRRIERLAFVATKTDHVPTLQRDNLRNLLRDLVNRTKEHVGKQRLSYHVAASVLSTVDGTAELGGRQVEVVQGVPLGEKHSRAFYPGNVPSSRPPESFWDHPYFEMPTFTPPPINPDGSTGIPHLGIDRVWHALLQDVLE